MVGMGFFYFMVSERKKEMEYEQEKLAVADPNIAAFGLS